MLQAMMIHLAKRPLQVRLEKIDSTNNRNLRNGEESGEARTRAHKISSKPQQKKMNNALIAITILPSVLHAK